MPRQAPPALRSLTGVAKEKGKINKLSVEGAADSMVRVAKYCRHDAHLGCNFRRLPRKNVGQCLFIVIDWNPLRQDAKATHIVHLINGEVSWHQGANKNDTKLAHLVRL
jgi:hypothetical protein